MITEAHRRALLWLVAHTGDGVLDRWGCVLAAGETGPFMRSTWHRLGALGLIEFYQHGRRLRITPAGANLAATWSVAPR